MRDEDGAVNFLYRRQILAWGDERQFVRDVVVIDVDLTRVLPMGESSAKLRTKKKNSKINLHFLSIANG